MDWTNPSYSRLPDPLFEIDIDDGFGAFSLPVIRLPIENMAECEALCDLSVKMYALLGFAAPPGSIKRIPAGRMVDRAIREGLIGPEKPFVEPTSGNMGVAMAYCAGQHSIPMIALVPDSLPEGKLAPIRRQGATVIKESMAMRAVGLTEYPGSVELARRYAEMMEGAFLNQYGNSWNPEGYEELVAPQLWGGIARFGSVSMFVSAIGSTGTLIGLGRYFKRQNPEIEIVATKPYWKQKIDGTRGDDRLWEISHDRTFLNAIEEPIDQLTARGYSDMLNKNGIPAGPSAGAATGSALHILLTKLGNGTLEAMRGPDGTIGVILPFADTLYPYA